MTSPSDTSGPADPTADEPTDGADPTCRFCAIVAGTQPGFLVLDEPDVVAFLDVKPLFPGHTLLVPRRHVEVLADLPAELVGPYFAAAQRLSAAMEDVLGAAGSFVGMNNRVSQSVPHLHTHVVPRNHKDGLRGFFWPRTTYADDAEAAAVAARLRSGLSGSAG
ncbi:MAG: HIT family protein [Acidimicrobiales bacterium]